MGSHRASTGLGSQRRFNGSAASDADDTVVSADSDLPQSMAPPQTSALRTELENSCNTPSCQDDFLPCRASATPDFGSDRGAAPRGSGDGADYAGQHAAHSGTLQGPTLLGPTHPCHAAILPCRLSATPPIRGSEPEREQPHASTARRTDGALDSHQVDAPPRCALTLRAEPPGADAFLPYRLSATPSLDVSWVVHDTYLAPYTLPPYTSPHPLPVTPPWFRARARTHAPACLTLSLALTLTLTLSPPPPRLPLS